MGGIWERAIGTAGTILYGTRRVISETKAIMSPPPLCHWMESNIFVEENEIII